MNTLSIVVPVYNSEKIINKCIDSLLGQTFKDIEIILVNDGSTDKSEEIISAYMKKDSRIKYFVQDNAGPAAARNLGISKAEGMYIQFVDSDDYVESVYCEKMIKAIESNNADMAICNYIEESEWIECCPFHENRIFNLEQYIMDMSSNPMGYYYGSAFNKIYKSSIIKENKICFPKEVRLGEDFIFNADYVRCIDKIVSIEDKLCHYMRYDQNSLTQKKKELELIIDERMTLYKVYEKLWEHIDNKNRRIISRYILDFYNSERKNIRWNAEDIRLFKEIVFEDADLNIIDLIIYKLEFEKNYFLKYGKKKWIYKTYQNILINLRKKLHSKLIVLLDGCAKEEVLLLECFGGLNREVKFVDVKNKLQKIMPCDFLVSTVLDNEMTIFECNVRHILFSRELINSNDIINELEILKDSLYWSNRCYYDFIFVGDLDLYNKAILYPGFENVVKYIG